MTSGEQLAKAIIGSVEGTEWPPTAEFKVEYRKRTWPMGYDRERTIIYFDDKASMDHWLSEQQKWCREEDNGIEYSVYKWDLGPEYWYSNWH